jgi:hypothetical protein
VWNYGALGKMIMTPEHLHLILNHVPIFGMACALLPLGVGIALKKKDMLLVGLILATASIWMTGPVMGTGESAHHKYLEGEVRPYLDPDVDDYLHAHEERAEVGSKIMYAAAVLALVSLVIYFKKPDWVYGVSTALWVVGLLSILAGAWIAESGGKIRRVDFRGAAEQSAPAPPRHGQEVED